jgi:hypothetical protein
VQGPSFDEMRHRLLVAYGSPAGLQLFKLWWCGETGQPCDVTFRHRKPLINVTVSAGFHATATLLTRARGRNRSRLFNRLFDAIPFSDGSVVAFDDIWTINPMPKGGISDKHMAAADLAQGDVKAGPNGETVRQMIRETYQCETAQEEEYYLRRWIAS